VHQWIEVWFRWVHDWGYAGIVLLMAMESSIFPIPSEVVIPPAAYWAKQGRFSLAGVIVAGTLGSWIGATVTYWVARTLGRALVARYGKYVFVPEHKLVRAERWLARYEAGGVFFARLVPVVRHLIGIPAGLVRMPFRTFSAMTLLGAGLWCSILAWFGGRVLGDRPDLMENPEALVDLLHRHTLELGAFALGLAVLYIVVLRLTGRPSS
jgi:membrane protein DedA with SNARE-associated domain